MAEFCVECWNKLYNKDLPAKDYILSRSPELCEHCGEYKKVVVMERRDAWFRYVRPFIIILQTFYLWRIKRQNKKANKKDQK